MRLTTYYYLACLATSASADHLAEREACASDYTLCSPAGATTTVVPQIGDSDFQNLFVDIVHSSLPASKRSLSTRDGASLCCISSLDCLTMNTLNLPFCYDKFTTNYFLPDGSFGTVVGGAFTSATKDSANLETGDYTLSNGTTGNFYSANEAAKPEIASLPMPVQFTASGVGSAIPASVLGDEITLTFTTTFSLTTIPATTIVATTITTSENVVFSSVVTTISNVLPNTIVASTASLAIPISTVQVTLTVAPTTIAATTKQASTAVITTTFNSAANPALFGDGSTAVTSATASATKKSGASSQGVPSLRIGLSIGICVLAGLTLL